MGLFRKHWKTTRQKRNGMKRQIPFVFSLSVSSFMVIVACLSPDRTRHSTTRLAPHSLEGTSTPQQAGQLRALERESRKSPARGRASLHLLPSSRTQPEAFTTDRQDTKLRSAAQRHHPKFGRVCSSREEEKEKHIQGDTESALTQYRARAKKNKGEGGPPAYVRMA